MPMARYGDSVGVGRSREPRLEPCLRRKRSHREGPDFMQRDDRSGMDCAYTSRRIDQTANWGGNAL